MSSPSLVSVVIPAYQSAKTLPRAVQSVLGQDYSNFEVVIVDNGSTDGTRNVVTDLMKLDGRIRLVSLEQNCRPAGGRNAGVEYSRGGYIAFLDADDEWLPGKLAEQVWFLDHFSQASVVVTDGMILDATSGSKQTYSEIYAPYFERLELNSVTETVRDVFWLDGSFRSILYEKCFLNTSSVVLRKSVFLELGGFDRRFFGPEDVDLWVRLAKAHRFVYCATTRVNRYISSTSLSAVSEAWLRALLGYHQVCFSSTEYADLKPLVIRNLFKYYRMLVIHYGRQRSIKAWKMVFESLRYGFDPLLPLYAVLTPFGSPAYDAGLKILDFSRNISHGSKR